MLFGGLSAAEAHDSTTETYEVEVPVYEWVTEPVMATRVVDVFDLVPTEVEVQRTREVGVFDFVPRQVQVQRTREVPVYDHVPQQFQVQRTRVVPVYDFVPTAVQVQRTRVVPVYNEVVETVRVAPFRERVTIQPPCEWVTVYGQRVYYCPSPRTTWRDVYNYRTTTRYVLVGTRTETYTATETQMVWTQTGTRTETYTATETKMVWTQVGTRTETYTATETQMVWTKVGTRTETYTATETQMMRTKTGTRTETYDTGATRLVKQDTGRTRTETRTRTVHTGCPDGYHDLGQGNGGVVPDPLPEAFIADDGEVHFSRHSDGREVAWVGPLDTDHSSCYQATAVEPAPSIVESVQRIVVAGAEYVVTAGEVVIDGVTYTVDAGNIVVESYENLNATFRGWIQDEIRTALEELDESVVAAICTNLTVHNLVSASAGVILKKVLVAAFAAAGIAVSAPPAFILGTAVWALLVAGCNLAKPWYTPDVPPTPTGLSLVSGDASLVVSWDPSPSRDTFQFEYRLRWKRSSQSWDDATTKKLGDSTTTYTITGLTNDTAYNVWIEAQNLGGDSAAVEASATPRDPTTTSTTTTTIPPDETATVPTVRTIPPYDRERFSLRGSSLSAVPGCRLWVYWVYSEPHRLAMHLCERS